MARRAARRGRRAPRRKRSNIKKMETGSLLRPRRTPTEFVSAPKNQITLTFRFTATDKVQVQTYQVKDIYKNIKLQLGIETTSSLNIQIQSISAWEMTGLSLLLGCYDLLEKGSEEIQIIEDQPGRNQWAAVGYRWPKSHQMIVFNTQEDSARNIFYVMPQETTSGCNLFIRLRLLWRGSKRNSPRMNVYNLDAPMTSLSMD